MNINWLKRIVPKGLAVLVLLTALLTPVLSNVELIYAADGDPYYWAGGTGNWSDVNHWSSTDDGTGGDFATPPNNTNNVYFATNAFTGAGQVVTVDTTAYCKDMDWTGATNNPTLTCTASPSELQVYGNITFILEMTMTNPNNRRILIRGGVTQTLTTNGITIPFNIWTYVSTTELSLQDNLTLSNYFDGQQGTLTTNNYNINLGSNPFIWRDPRSGGTAVYNLGSSIINCGAWTDNNYTGTGTQTFNANTATINITGTGALTGGSVDYNGASFNLNGTAHTVSGSFTCATLTRNGTATKTDTVTFTSGNTVTCTTFAMKGNSATNRLLVKSSTLGSAATITATNWTGTQNVDIMDITATNAIDLSAVTGNSGDCGGNTNITFTEAAAQTWDGTTGSWSTAAKWTSRVPLPQDNVSAGGTGNTITLDMPRLGKSVTYTGTATITKAINPTAIYGSLIMNTGTYNNATYEDEFRGRGAYTITTNGNQGLRSINLYAPSGSLTLQDNVYVSYSVLVYNGTLTLNDKDVSTGEFGAIGTSTKALNLGSGTITVRSAGPVSKLAMIATGLTFDAGTSTIILTNSGANAQTFAGGGLTYNNVIVQGAGNYALTITGNNTFNTFKVDASAAAKGITATGTTQTVNDFTRDAGGTGVITITNGTWTKSDATDIFLDYLSVSGSTATPANTWYAGNHAVNGGGNTDWVFDDPVLTVTTNAATGITMDKDGVTGGNFNGTIGTLAGTPYIGTGFEYGLTNAYGTTTANVNKYAYGAYSAAIPNSLTPGETYHFRGRITDDNAASPFVGLDDTFTFTMPTVNDIGATVAGSHIILSGSVTNMGVASDTYVYFEWGVTPAYGNTTAPQTLAAIGGFSATIDTPNEYTLLYYRAIAQNGTTLVYGAGSTLNVPSGTGGLLIRTMLRILIASVLLVGVMKLGSGNSLGMLVFAILGITAYFIIDAIINTVL